MPQVEMVKLFLTKSTSDEAETSAAVRATPKAATNRFVAASVSLEERERRMPAEVVKPTAMAREELLLFRPQNLSIRAVGVKRLTRLINLTED